MKNEWYNYDNTENDLRLKNGSIVNSDVIGISANLGLLHVFCRSWDFFLSWVHFQHNYKIISRARSVHLWPCLGEEKERQRKIHMHAITLYSVISFNYTTIYIYIYIYIYTRLQKGCLQTDRYDEWVISIKYVKKRT